MKKSIEIGLFDLIPGIRLFGSLLKKFQICFVELNLIIIEKSICSCLWLSSKLIREVKGLIFVV